MTFTGSNGILRGGQHTPLGYASPPSQVMLDTSGKYGHSSEVIRGIFEDGVI